jgi:hypothetical protein
MVDSKYFITGLKLSELFYEEVVKQILQTEFPNLAYSVGLLGGGSEVLGFDTPQSMDHDWGPRFLLFLSDTDLKDSKGKISKVLSAKLPCTFRNIPTNFRVHEQSGAKVLEKITSGPVNHRIDIYSIDSFLKFHLKISENTTPKAVDWLTFPEQRLIAISSGKVFFDGLNKLLVMQEKYKYYPHDVWLYLLSSQWMKISQEESFVGRCANVGDEIGSHIISVRIARYLMKLGFLMEMKYAPYSKWFGTAFSKLEIAKELSQFLTKVLQAKNYKERETSLCQAYEIVAQKHNSLKITPSLETKPSNFYNRPYLIIHGDVFCNEIKKQINDEEVKSIAKSNIGSVDQFVDSTDVLSHQEFIKLKVMYQEG